MAKKCLDKLKEPFEKKAVIPGIEDVDLEGLGIPDSEGASEPIIGMSDKNQGVGKQEKAGAEVSSKLELLRVEVEAIIDVLSQSENIQHFLRVQRGAEEYELLHDLKQKLETEKK